MVRPRAVRSSSGGGASESISGLSWDGTAVDGTVKRGFYIPAGAANGCDATPCTLLMQQLHRDQVGTTERFYTGVFYGNHEDFDDFSNYGLAYWGFHGYPIGASGSGTICLELAGGVGFGTPTDDTTRDDGSQPAIGFDVWAKRAIVTNHIGTGLWTRKLYCDLPSTSTANLISNDRFNSAADVEPPVPVFMFGQTGQRIDPPNNGVGRSWGGQIRYEEFSGVQRAIQIYNEALSEAHVIALSAKETNAEVLAYCSANSITSLWYLNMNPTPSDVTNKGGSGPNGVWDGANRPSQWTP